MTTAKLVTSPSEGHGLTSKLTDPLYSALANGRPTETIVALVVLKPVGLGQRETAKGRHQHVVFEAVRVEPIHDRNQSNELRYLAQALYEQRTSTGEQRSLPLGLGGDEEKRLALMERIEKWSADKGLTGGQLEALWREKHGIGPDEDWSFGDQGVPGDYRKASLAHLTGFAYDVEALDITAKLPHEDREEDDEDADTDASPTADETAAAAVAAGCEVCNSTDGPLTDGLCADCAKTTGTPVTDIGKKRPRKATGS